MVSRSSFLSSLICISSLHADDDPFSPQNIETRGEDWKNFVELIKQPKVLILDEPTSGLDSTTAIELCTALKNMSKLGMVGETINMNFQKILLIQGYIILHKMLEKKRK